MSKLHVTHGWVSFHLYNLPPYGVRISAVEFVTPNQVFQLNTARATETLDALAPEITEVLKTLAQGHWNGHSHFVDDSDARFYKKFGSLVLEDLQISQSRDDQICLRFRVTAGEFSDLITTSMTAQDTSALSDVVLPLSNLSSYLRSMCDAQHQDHVSKALDATAGRIDEFLIAYGGRIRDCAPQGATQQPSFEIHTG